MNIESAGAPPHVQKQGTESGVEGAATLWSAALLRRFVLPLNALASMRERAQPRVNHARCWSA